jgi:hypothetical protein
VDDWKQKVSSAFMEIAKTQEVADIMARRVKYAFFTNAGVVFMGYYNHGWYYPQYFVPFSALKGVLKPDFRATYVK